MVEQEREQLISRENFSQTSCVPVYFIRARPTGQRLKPVLLFFVLVIGWTCLGMTTLTVIEYLAG